MTLAGRRFNARGLRVTMETERTFVLDASAQPDRLDRTLARTWNDLSRSRLQALIREGRVTVDGEAVLDPAWKAASNSIVRLTLPPPAPATLQAERIALAVVYEDDDVIVVDKPPGLVVHPAAGHETGTLVNALIAHCGASLSGIGGVGRPGIVHRLDKDTSGLLVAAKNDLAHRSLAEQFADHGRSGPLERVYLALVWGAPARPQGVINAPLGRSVQNREKIAVTGADRGRRAVTHYAVLESFRAEGEALACLVRCTLETGRTHQIRVHMTHLGHPLLGDALYGAGFKTKASRLGEAGRSALTALNRQALHAAVLGFEHPSTKKPLRFESPPPADMQAVLDALRREAQPS
jgi:23S rRNA pseudouridine1911/1915/1917 synthase